MDVKTYDIINTISKIGAKILKINSNRFEIAYNNNPNRFVLRRQSSDLLVLNQVIIRMEYEVLVELVEEYFHCEDIKFVVDAGANIGLTSLYFSGCFKNAKIFSIEPSPENFLTLESNISHNKCTQILPFQNALWFERAKLTISNAFRDGQDWSTQVSTSPYGMGEVKALTISDLIEIGEIDEIDILKMDIEGSEAKLFESKEFLNELKKIKFLAVELHEEMVDKITIINLLQDLGFKLKYKGETLLGVNLKVIRK